MIGWQAHSQEEAFLFNPAFLATILVFLAQGYHRENGRGIPFSLAFLGIALAVSPDIREALPRRATSSMAAWLEEHPSQRVDFPERAEALVDFVRAGVLFGVRQKGLKMLPGGALAPGSLVRNSKAVIQAAGPEVLEVVKVAEFLGRWIAHAGTPATVLALWGIRP